MRRFLFLLFAVGSLFSCSNDENSGMQDDLKKIQERLDAIEKGKTVINVEFKDTNMIVTYSSGEKVTIPLPKGLDGINGTNGKDGTNGTNGKDGVGIQTITYNEVTSILKITLTNGNISEFKIVTSGSGLSAVLLSDTNGAYLLTNVYMGALNFANITYNDKNQVASIVNNIIEERQQAKSTEIVSEYANGLLVGVTEKRFATANNQYWDYFHVSENYTIKYYNNGQVPSSDFICTKEAGKDTYTLEVYNKDSKASKIYQNAYMHTYLTDAQQSIKSEANFDWNEVIKITDSRIIQPSRGIVYSSTYRSADKKWVNVVYLTSYAISNLLSNTKLGDVISSRRFVITNNSKGLMTAITCYRTGVTQPEYELRLTYNAANKVVKSEKYVQVNGAWAISGDYLAYEYNATNQVTCISRFGSDGKSAKVQETVYDKNGNPIEIYALQNAVYSWDSWYNPETNRFENGRIIKPRGFRLLAKFEYNYQLKNFFGNSISAINPLLDHYKIVNAIKRAWSAEEYSLNGWIDYTDYDEFGYPKTMILNGTNGNGESGRFDIRLTYQKKK